MKIKSLTHITLALTLVALPNLSRAQKEQRENINIQGDMVSSYVWRGIYESGSSIQPTMGLIYKDLSISDWGSVDITGQGYKENDITFTYSHKGMNISLTDYWWGGQSGIYNKYTDGKNRYFNLDNHITDHILETGLSYTLPIKQLPICLSWYTMLWGNDKKTCNNRTPNAYSTYNEISCPFTTKETDLQATIGFSPFNSPTIYKNKRFAVTNISIKVSKVIPISDKFSIPAFCQLILNPNKEDVHLVLGITLK